MWRSLSNKFARFLNCRLAFRCSFEMSQCRCHLQTASFTPTHVHIHAHMHVFTHSCTNTHMYTLIHEHLCPHVHTLTLPPHTVSQSHSGKASRPCLLSSWARRTSHCCLYSVHYTFPYLLRIFAFTDKLTKVLRICV